MNVYRGSYKEASYEMSLNFGPVVSEVFLIKTGSRSFVVAVICNPLLY